VHVRRCSAHIIILGIGLVYSKEVIAAEYRSCRQDILCRLMLCVKNIDMITPRLGIMGCYSISIAELLVCTISSIETIDHYERSENIKFIASRVMQVASTKLERGLGIFIFAKEVPMIFTKSFQKADTPSLVHMQALICIENFQPRDPLPTRTSGIVEIVHKDASHLSICTASAVIYQLCVCDG